MTLPTCPTCGGRLECFEGSLYCADCDRFELADGGHALDAVCLAYVEAHDRGDFATQAALWNRAASDPALERALREIDEALAEEGKSPPSTPA
jgi:hypothetical protein